MDGTAFYADGEERGTVSAGPKTFAALGAYIIIMPDMACYNKLTGEFGSLNASWTGAAQIVDGTYGGETAKSNTIEASGVDFTTLFKPGRAPPAEQQDHRRARGDGDLPCVL